ncbi:MAG TPA: hypothetical protein ENH09_02360, partial [Bacteroidetes bacterium]|nr:hypothetical protein [Bacteroidota bacterium]
MDLPEQPKEIQRMSLSLRIQHIVLLTSMIILSLTGLALKFHDNWFAHFVMQIEGGFEARGIIHRIFAVILILVGIYHSFYVLFSDEGHRDLMKLVPKLKDLKDFFRYWRRNITGSREKIPFGKYSF